MEMAVQGKELLRSRIVPIIKEPLAQQKGLLVKDIGNTTIIPWGDAGAWVVSQVSLRISIEGLTLKPKMRVGELADQIIRCFLGSFDPNVDTTPSSSHA